MTDQYIYANYDGLLAGTTDEVKGQGALIKHAGSDVLKRGTVLGKILFALGTVTRGGTGDGTVTGVALGKGAKIGNYVLTCTAASTNTATFQVIDPEGYRLADATVGAAYVGPVCFTVNDGSTDFTPGATITIPVTGATGSKWVIVNSANVDGSQFADAVLLSPTVDPRSADAAAVIAYQGEYNGDKLIFGGADTLATHLQTLRNKGIIVKTNQMANSVFA